MSSLNMPLLFFVAAFAGAVVAYLATIGTAVFALCGIGHFFEKRAVRGTPARVNQHANHSATKNNRYSTFLGSTNSGSKAIPCNSPACNAENPLNAHYCRRCGAGTANDRSCVKDT
jgi:hypothetical protein